jgi:hypothetical protein
MPAINTQEVFAMSGPTYYPTYDEWFATLSTDQQSKANELVSTLRALGADCPEDWARSEVSEDIPQLARFLVLRRIWPDLIDSWRREPDRWIRQSVEAAGRNPKGHFADAGAALRRMTESGVSTADIASVARMVAYETAFGVVDIIDEGHEPDAPSTAPRWALMEFGADGRMTGRDVCSLHEDILSMDPSGREGQPT